MGCLTTTGMALSLIFLLMSCKGATGQVQATTGNTVTIEDQRANDGHGSELQHSLLLSSGGADTATYLSGDRYRLTAVTGTEWEGEILQSENEDFRFNETGFVEFAEYFGGDE